MIDLRKILRGDKIIWVVFFSFLLFSIMEQFSAGSALTYKQGIYAPILRHTLCLLSGGVIMVALSHFPIRCLRSPWVVWGLYAATLGLQLLTFTRLGADINGATRWVRIHGQLIQPSEFLKVTLMLAVARLMWRYEETKDTDGQRAQIYYWGALVAILVPAASVAFSNLSTCIIMVVSGGFVMFLGGLKIKHVFLLATALILGLGGLYGLHTKGVEFGERSHLTSAFKRIDKMREPSDPATKFVLNSKDNSTFQGRMCKVAIADGRMPKGPGNSMVRDTLPLAYADCIFAICVEDLGLAGAFFLVMLYFIILYRGGHIAVNSPDLFSALVVGGLSLMLTMQAIISMLVVCGFGPNTGQPLPFISWGWWDIWSMCAVLGLVLSASYHTQTTQVAVTHTEEKPRRRSTRHRQRQHTDEPSIIEELEL